MPKELNLCEKEVKPDEAYEVWQTPDGQWTWYVLKKYQGPSEEANNIFAKWHCLVTSPIDPEGTFEDVYVSEIKDCADMLDYNPLKKQEEEKV